MFAKGYFPGRYFPARYFPASAGAIVAVLGAPPFRALFAFDRSTAAIAHTPSTTTIPAVRSTAELDGD
jgi:hypothetical protein